MIDGVRAIVPSRPEESDLIARVLSKDPDEQMPPPKSHKALLKPQQVATLREWIKEMLKNGKIRRSTSPVGSPILFVPKPHGRRLQLCVDYRAVNRITIPNRYPLPLMQELQD